MTDSLLWNFYAAEPVKDGGWVVVHRSCANADGPNVFASLASNTVFEAYRVQKKDATKLAAERNANLGDDFIPYPFDK